MCRIYPVRDTRLTTVNLPFTLLLNGHSLRSSEKPHYNLSEVKSLVNEGRVEINKDARKDADDCFGWKQDKIIKAIQRLRLSDFYKKEPKYDTLQTIMVDYYKARNMMGEQVYIHFRIDEDENGKLLVICSFKRI